MPDKKIPLRLCIGCMQMKPKSELIRIVRDKDGNMAIDKKGRMPGRGAYLCNDMNCYLAAQKGKRIDKAFKTAIGAEVYSLLKEAMENE